MSDPAATKPAILGGPPAFPDGLPLVRPHVGAVAETVNRLERVVASGMLTNGPVVRELEGFVADYLGVRHVVAVASCTSGLMLVLQACGVDGRVVLPSFTFAASAHVVHWVGATPAFVDAEPERMTIDTDGLGERLQGASALLATHVYGTPCAVERLGELASAAGIPLVYDAAHGLGSRRRGRPIGSFGDAEVFSLSPTKVVTGGEGGLVATNDDAIADACRIGRDYGNPGDYDCLFPGLNARMSDLHATVALASIQGLDERVAWRGKLVDQFADTVAATPGLRVVTPEPGDTSTFKDLTLVIDPDAYGLDAAGLQRAFKAEGIDSRRYFYPPVHQQKAYAGLPAAHLPVTERLAPRVLSPPLWSDMDGSMIDTLADVVARLHTHATAVRAQLSEA